MAQKMSVKVFIAGKVGYWFSLNCVTQRRNDSKENHYFFAVSVSFASLRET